MANLNPSRVYNARNITEYAIVSNYTTNARKRSHNKGLQTTCLVCNIDGVPTAYDVSKFNFYGSEWANTGWTPTYNNPWTIESVLYNDLSNNRLSGTELPYILFGTDAETSGIKIQVNNITLTAASSLGYCHICIVFDENHIVSLYYNGIFVSSGVVSTFTASKPFWIGNLSNRATYTISATYPIKLFTKQDRPLSAQEVTEAYNAWLSAQGA